VTATHDGGASWQHFSVLPGITGSPSSGHGGTPLDASFGSSTDGWLAEQNFDGHFEIMATADAGRTWSVRYRSP
jgi:hypothetical protein